MDITAFLQLVNDNIHLIVQLFTGIGVIAGGFYTLFKWIIPTVKAIQSHIQMVELVAKEFHPNGGSSMRDALNRLEVGVSDIRDTTVKLVARQWALVTTQRDPIFESDSRGLTERANASLLALAERPMESIIGSGWENIIHVDDRSRIWTEWSEAVVRSRTFESDFRVVGASSGRVYKVHCIATPFSEDSSGPVLGFIGRYTDVKLLKEKSADV